MSMQQIAIYESLKAFMLRIGYAQPAEQCSETWSAINHSNYKAMMTFKFGEDPNNILIPTKLELVHRGIREHSAWEYLAEFEVNEGEEPAEREFLYGTSRLPSMVGVGMEPVQLGVIVCRAFDDSGLTTSQWNALGEGDRDAKIMDALEQMRFEATPVVAADATEGPVLGEVTEITTQEDDNKRTLIHVELEEGTDPEVAQKIIETTIENFTVVADEQKSTEEKTEEKPAEDSVPQGEDTVGGSDQE